MLKQDFINILIEKENNTSIFQGRFSRTYTNSDEHWTYIRPAVDCMEPTIDLSKDGVVMYINFCGFDSCEKTELTYYEFLNLYKK